MPVPSTPTTALPFQRIVAVHAHPDDETITMGGTFARIMQAGGAVTLVTCTRGEAGEVMPGVGQPGVAGNPQQLGALRSAELTAAMAALGVRDHRFLGERPVSGSATDSPAAADIADAASAAPVAGTRRDFTDSGMVWAPGPGRRAIAPPNMPMSALCYAPLDEQVPLLAAILREVNPDAIVTYEPGGGYGHPDHVRAHDITYAAAAMVGMLERLYYNVIPESQYVAAVIAANDFAPLEWVRPAIDAPHPARVVLDAEFAARAGVTIDVAGVRNERLSALRHHATQAVVAHNPIGDVDAFAMTDFVAQPLLPREFFVSAVSQPRGVAAPEVALMQPGALSETVVEEVKPAHETPEASTRASILIGIVMGIVLAIVGVGVHRLVVPVAQGEEVHYFPIGLVLVGLLATSLTIYVVTGARRLLPAVVALLAWLVAAVFLGGPSVGGGTLVAGFDENPVTKERDISGLLFYVLSLVPQIAVITVFWVRRLVSIVREARLSGEK